MIQISKPKFTLGRCVATPGALEALEQSNQSSFEFIAKHSRGDWGIVDSEDKQANDDALIDGERLLSAYRTSKGVKLWIITEADRSVTTVLLPAEY